MRKQTLCLPDFWLEALGARWCLIIEIENRGGIKAPKFNFGPVEFEVSIRHPSAVRSGYLEIRSSREKSGLEIEN